ncbi:hypothetical protein [Azospirillum thermophilum]|uniref:Uncharacterized protein n=1 Tax=Azospirillum thermophilum TaxID=2202148 RepID=A0A2S2CZN5_9PROT|nr:hypothetical protein [Azospirillum thermophilum]AWK89905.1 hypothetical protein DEW08_28220 [Azospirillum thermophilum]
MTQMLGNASWLAGTGRPAADGIRPAVRIVMAEAGFRPIDTGNGRPAWFRRAGDGTHHALISFNGGLDGDPQAAGWVAGVYGERGGIIEVAGITLARAIDAADQLPSPVRADGSLIEALYPSLDQAMDDLS